MTANVYPHRWDSTSGGTVWVETGGRIRLASSSRSSFYIDGGARPLPPHFHEGRDFAGCGSRDGEVFAKMPLAPDRDDERFNLLVLDRYMLPSILVRTDQGWSVPYVQAPLIRERASRMRALCGEHLPELAAALAAAARAETAPKITEYQHTRPRATGRESATAQRMSDGRYWFSVTYYRGSARRYAGRVSGGPWVAKSGSLNVARLRALAAEAAGLPTALADHDRAALLRYMPEEYLEGTDL